MCRWLCDGVLRRHQGLAEKNVLLASEEIFRLEVRTHLDLELLTYLRHRGGGDFAPPTPREGLNEKQAVERHMIEAI